MPTKHLTLLPPPLQAYLKEFNDLLGELKGKHVGIFAITAQSQADADKAVRDWTILSESSVKTVIHCCYHNFKEGKLLLSMYIHCRRVGFCFLTYIKLCMCL